MPTEDEIYLTSTQYRLWTFSASKLVAMRTETNRLARDQVRAAILRERKRKHASSSEEDTKDNDKIAGKIDFLTVDEEKTLVDFYCVALMDMVRAEQELSFASGCIPTAVQYMKRFYLTNSVMSYQPKNIMATALYLATKLENTHVSARSLAARLAKVVGLENTTAEEVAAPEFILTQGLLFNLDIRHPQRALKGAFLEFQMLIELMKAKTVPEGLENLRLTDEPPEGNHIGEVRQHLFSKYKSPEELSKRVNTAYSRGTSILKTEAVVSDAYFLYTPPQIMLAALMLADEDLALTLYSIRLKRGSRPTPASTEPDDAILAAVRKCASHLRACGSAWKDELRKKHLAIEKKLRHCRNPEKVDLVERHRAQKRDATVDGQLDDTIAKKRKTQRERAEKEGNDLFGPALGK